MSPARLLASIPFVLVLVTLSGCATPDFKPFASETAALGGAISAEQDEVRAHIAKVETRAAVRNPNDLRIPFLQTQQEKYAQDAAAIDAIMSVAVDYSGKLVELAARGETGKEAADSLAASLKGMGEALGIAGPAAAVPAWASALWSETAAAVTRVQAQQSLTDALKVADPAVAHIADTVASIYKKNGPIHKVVAGLQINEQGVLTDEVGLNRLAFYRGVNVDTVTVAGKAAQTRLEYFFGDVDDRIGKQSPAAGICGLTRPVAAGAADLATAKEDPHCLTGQVAQGLAAVTVLLAGIEPQFRAYSKDVMDSKLWAQQRLAAGDRIAAAAQVWAAEHHAITEQMEKCGGLRSLRKECGNLTFANLKLFVDRVKAVSGKGDNNGGQ